MVHIQTADTISNLHQFLKLKKGFRGARDGYFLRAESFYNVATYMDSVDYLAGYGNKSLHQRSHGEAFMALLTNKFRGQGLYLLDEPEAALSPSRQLAALAAIDLLVQAESQFIIATHSPIIMAYPDAWIYVLGGSDIVRVPYKQTEHYKVMRDFLVRSDQMVDVLIGKELTLFDGLRDQGTAR